jgi:hypothetical protein
MFIFVFHVQVVDINKTVGVSLLNIFILYNFFLCICCEVGIGAQSELKLLVLLDCSGSQGCIQN